MKKIYLPLVALSVTAASAFAGDAPQVQMRGDCEEQVRLAVGAAEQAADYSFEKKDDGSVVIDAAAQARVVISNTRVIRTTGHDERIDVTYKADLGSKDSAFKGTVTVTSTRGGCFINSLNLQGR
jgi:hypothetical protein